MATVLSGQPYTSSSSFLSLHQESYVSQIVPSQYLAQPMAMSLAFVRSWGEQAVSIVEQTSRCCMVCLMPQSQVSGSVENPHFNMLTLDRPSCVRSLLSAFQVVSGFSAPAGRCSSALMSRCTLASRGSGRSRHSSKRAAFAAVSIGLVHVIKLFRDLRRGTTPRCPLRGCLSSVACRVRSVRLATALLMYDGAIPASTGRLLVFVGIIHPVIILQVYSVSRPVSLHGWTVPTLGKHTLQLSSARADDLSVVGVAPHFEVLSLRMMLFLSFWSSRYDRQLQEKCREQTSYDLLHRFHLSH